MKNVTEIFRRAAEEHGLMLPSQIPLDKITRCPTARNPKGQNGAFFFTQTPIPAGWYQNWADGKGCQNWRDDSNRPNLTSVEAEAWKRQQQALQEAQCIERKARAKEAADRAEMLWQRADAANDTHLYLIKKGVSANGVRQAQGNLLIPVWDVDGQIHGMQYIGSNGRKSFMIGTAKTGHFFEIQGNALKPIVICEGYATAASIFEATGYSAICAFDAGNLKHVALAIAKDLSQTGEQRAIIIAADDDETGRKAALEAAQEANACIAYPLWPNGEKPDGASDMNDLASLEGGISAVLNSLRAAKPWRDIEPAPANENTARKPSTEPLPLFDELPPNREYPIDALGAFANVVRAVSNAAEAHESIAGSALLAALSLACQGLVDVKLPHGQVRPTSLYFLTIAASGERKSATESHLMTAVHNKREALQKIYEKENVVAQARIDAWNSERDQIKKQKGMENKVEKLKELGEAPKPALMPLFLAKDVTVEGLCKFWLNARGSLGLFHTEAGVFLGGHGFSVDQRLKTAANLCALWDGDPIERLRSGDGFLELRGRRLAAHLMIQPEPAQNFLGDSLIREQGFQSRLLISAPLSLAGTRFYKPEKQADLEVIKGFASLLSSLLNIDNPTTDGRNQLCPRIIGMSEAAKEIWIAFYNKVQAATGKGGDLESLPDVAGKAAENAGRMAAILTIANNPRAKQIEAAEMEGAAIICAWHIAEFQRLRGSGFVNPLLLAAQELLRHLQKQPTGEVGFRELLRLGPAKLRKKAELDRALAVLNDHGWIELINGGKLIILKSQSIVKEAA